MSGLLYTDDNTLHTNTGIVFSDYLLFLRMYHAKRNFRLAMPRRPPTPTKLEIGTGLPISYLVLV